MIKTLKYTLLVLLTGLMAACEKEEIGGTETESLAGEWMVTVDAVKFDGTVVLEDPFGMGYFQILTYNTAANNPNEMFVSDMGNFWEFTCKIPCDAVAQTFGSSTPVPNMDYDCNVTITNGKVVYKGTLSPSGATVDAIEFMVNFDDDDYPAAYGYDTYLVKGYRRTGLAGGTE